MSDAPDSMREAVAGLSPAALRALIAAAAEQLAAAPRPTIVSREIAVEADGRARMPLAIPQWTTEDGKARGVVIQYWDYKSRRLAEERATDRRPGLTQGQIDNWRRLLEEVAAGIVEPAGLSISTIERWGYAVVLFIHAAIERLGDLPPAIIAAELAQLAGAPAPASPDDPPPAPPLHDPADLGGEPGA